MKLKLSLLLALSCVCSPLWSQAYTETRYPFVMAHTFLGFEKIAFIEYWYGIPRALQKDGAQVFTTRVSAVNSSEVRGEQLLAQVEEVLAITGAEKVNLIGHSLGGQTVRYVAAMIPDKVASVTSIGSPVKGTPPGDIAEDLLKIKILQPVIPAMLEGLAQVVDLASGGDPLPQDGIAGINTLTTAGNADFNARFPAGVPNTDCGEGDYEKGGIYYFSWAGSTAEITNTYDITSIVFQLTKLLFDEPNNGLIGRCSSHFGQVIRDDYEMDHLDEVNQLFGVTSTTAIDPREIYRQHANRLVNLGL